MHFGVSVDGLAMFARGLSALVRARVVGQHHTLQNTECVGKVTGVAAPMIVRCEFDLSRAVADVIGDVAGIGHRPAGQQPNARRPDPAEDGCRRRPSRRRARRGLSRRKYWDAIGKDLRPVYTAATEQAAKERFGEFAEQWGDRYPAIVRLWQNSWSEFVPFLDYSPEIRRVLYSTNAIESLNARLRRSVKARGHFPTEQAA